MKKPNWEAIAAIAGIIGVIVAYLSWRQPVAVPASTDALRPTATSRSANESVLVTSPIRMELVRVPSGDFLMGSDPAKDTQASDREEPQHRVTLSEFYIGKYEVTNVQYGAFVTATGHRAPGYWMNGIMPAGKEDHPVAYVLWEDGMAFAHWLGKETGMDFRLCSEAEWEKACRGASSLIYPWGNSFDANKANTELSGIGETTQAGKFSPPGDSPYGVSDMAGNVWELVADWYDKGYYGSSPVENPQGPESGDFHVMRGGSFAWEVVGARCAYRLLNFPNDWYPDYGFRVCVSPGP